MLIMLSSICIKFTKFYEPKLKFVMEIKIDKCVYALDLTIDDHQLSSLFFNRQMKNGNPLFRFFAHCSLLRFILCILVLDCGVLLVS